MKRNQPPLKPIQASILGFDLTEFQQHHTFLQGVIFALVTRAAINEVRRRIEKPVLDAAGRKVSQAASDNLKPDTEAITVDQWAKLAVCVALDLAGDVSEAVPVLGEFTDIGFAPAEAWLLKALFKSNAIAAFGFAEEILPFTDVIPTFTLSWCLSTLWPTTPLAQKLLPEAREKAQLREQGGT
eukprot:CAMPEP_0172620428 /NCGR_PEP_ID=MMETSP1068-20121228/103476_1 /TAXON_ID=35684 /ORGANISM="Pseudopedinella elastica, Strain CCMP716" /LENGTH=183 /DNA_ID=CAMNT_0013427681 /DNA_START=106 /DNA_END=657 /DNA_ORIENTATION=+